MNDTRGVPVSGGSAKGLEVYEQALRALNSYRDDPVAIIDQVLAGDKPLARALAEERVALKPHCPFSRELRARAMQ